MQFEFAHERLKRLYAEKEFTDGRAPAIVKGFRKVMQAIAAATDERDLYARPALRYEKLEGRRAHERSLRINDQYRVVVELLGIAPNKKFRIIDIEDYH